MPESTRPLTPILDSSNCFTSFTLSYSSSLTLVAMTSLSLSFSFSLQLLRVVFFSSYVISFTRRRGGFLKETKTRKHARKPLKILCLFLGWWGGTNQTNLTIFNLTWSYYLDFVDSLLHGVKSHAWTLGWVTLITVKNVI